MQVSWMFQWLSVPEERLSATNLNLENFSTEYLVIVRAKMKKREQTPTCATEGTQCRAMNVRFCSRFLMMTNIQSTFYHLGKSFPILNWYQRTKPCAHNESKMMADLTW